MGKRRVYDRKDISDIQEEIIEYRASYDYSESLPRDINPVAKSKEIQSIFSVLSCKKSHNPVECAPLKVMKSCSIVFAAMLVWLFNEIISCNSVPSLFKKPIQNLYSKVKDRERKVQIIDLVTFRLL